MNPFENNSIEIAGLPASIKLNPGSNIQAEPVVFNKLRFTLNDVSVVVRELSKAVREFIRNTNLPPDQIIISIPHPLRQAMGWYMNGHTMDAPEFFRSIKIVPAHENKIAIFAPDWQLLDIDPIFLEINNPAFYD